MKLNLKSLTGFFNAVAIQILTLLLCSGAGVSAGSFGGPGVCLQGGRGQPDRAGVRGL